MRLSAAVFLNGLDHRRCADDRRVGENFVQHFRAEIVIRIGLTDDNGFELFSAVQYISRDAVGVAAGKAGVEQDGFLLAADQGGVHAKTAGRRVVHGEAQIVFGLCRAERCQPQSQGSGESGEGGGFVHGIAPMYVNGVSCCGQHRRMIKRYID